MIGPSFVELKLHAENQDLERFNRLKGFITNPDSLQSPAPPQLSDQIPYSKFSPVVGRQPELPPLIPSGTTGTCTYQLEYPMTTLS